MINYARLMPVYITKIFYLKEKGPDTWQMFHHGNFFVNKISILFFPTGVYHAIQQEDSS